MDKVKLEDFRCEGAVLFGGTFIDCGKIPKPGDKIYSCSACFPRAYRCQGCSDPKIHRHGSRKSALQFEPNLSKLVSELFTPPCNESPKREYFCSNSKKGCKEEFLAQKAHEKSCIYQEVPCPSLDCKEIMTFKGVDDHMKQCHKMLEVNKEWNFEGTEKDLNETICCLSSYGEKFFSQVFVKDKNLHFKVIILNHQVNAIPFDVIMTFFLENGKNISMKDCIYPVTKNDKQQFFSNILLEKVTEYFDVKSMEMKCQPKIDFCLKVVNEKLDDIAKDKKENVKSGNLFAFIQSYQSYHTKTNEIYLYFTGVDSDEEPITKKAKKSGQSIEMNCRSSQKSKNM